MWLYCGFKEPLLDGLPNFQSFLTHSIVLSTTIDRAKSHDYVTCIYAFDIDDCYITNESVSEETFLNVTETVLTRALQECKQEFLSLTDISLVGYYFTIICDFLDVPNTVSCLAKSNYGLPAILSILVGVLYVDNESTTTSRLASFYKQYDELVSPIPLAFLFDRLTYYLNTLYLSGLVHYAQKHTSTDIDYVLADESIPYTLTRIC